MDSPAMRTSCKICFGVVLLILAGCTNMLTKRSIERFNTGLESQNLEQLQAATSEAFEQRALRLPEGAKDLKVLKVPTAEKFKVEKVEKIDDEHKRAIVKIGKKKEQQKTVEYLLTWDKTTRHWVVDDLILEPNPNGQNPPSIAEQMDLLLTAREFVAAWQGESRDQQFAYCTDEFQGTLSALPPDWFAALTRKTMGNGRQRTTKPQARMNGADAVVVVAHPEGELFLELKKEEEWQVNDVALQTKGNDGSAIPSVKKLAHTLNQSAEFLAAYGAADRARLQTTATAEFYERCLAAADLSTVPLPVAELLVKEFEFRHYPERRELLFDNHGISYMLTLKPVDVDLAAKEGRDPELKIEEITLFEEQGQQVKRVSAMFLSHAVVQLFGEALHGRDVHSLRKLSSHDFNGRVWDRDTAKMLTAMPLPEIESPEVRVISTVFRGDATEVTATQGTRAVTYVLNLQDNWMVVDDVVLPSQQRPTSLKKNLEILLPMYAFTSALYQRNLADLLTHSANGLDSIVWRQVDQVPQLEVDLTGALMQPVAALEAGQPWSVVRLGNEQQGTEVRLVREGNRYVVHDLTYWGPDLTTGKLELLGTLRQRLATGEIPTRMLARRGNLTVSHGADIIQASGELPSRDGNIPQELPASNVQPLNPSGVTPALYETPAE